MGQSYAIYLGSYGYYSGMSKVQGSTLIFHRENLVDALKFNTHEIAVRQVNIIEQHLSGEILIVEV